MWLYLVVHLSEGFVAECAWFRFTGAEQTGVFSSSVAVYDKTSPHLQAQKDVEELRTLVASASRKRVQDMLSNELRRMEIEVSPSFCS